MNLAVWLKEALRYASVAHEKAGDRYGPDPYKVHLLAVLSVAFEFEVTEFAVLVACPLHDVIEDTAVTLADVKMRYGSRVAALVDAVSDPIGYKNRKERKAAAYPRIKAVPSATVLKLADRIANVRSCWNEAKAEKRNKSLLGMYKKEYGSFRKALKGKEVDKVELVMWAELDRLLAWRT